MTIIDGHAHACGLYYDSSSIVGHLDKNNIEKVLLCGGEKDSRKNYSYPVLSKIFRGESLIYFFNKLIKKIVHNSHASNYIDLENHRVMKISKTLPERVLNVYWFNPEEDNFINKMDKFYKAHGFVMVKAHQCWTPFDIGGETFLESVNWCKKNKIPMFLHLYSKEQVEKFVEIANNNSDVIFIIGHMIGVLYMTNTLKSTNVYFDLSAPQLYSENIMKKALEVFGFNRLILGSDTPYGSDNIKIVIERLNNITDNEDEKRKVSYGNIMEILNRD